MPTAEDVDKFQDDDGCPDYDNDQDGLRDEIDQCPMEQEDKDGFQDEDGCADTDNDQDGVVDRFDRCPTQAETKMVTWTMMAVRIPNKVILTLI